ncbi:hypothetical protein [uncultured Clostridium sp.]|uniref:hypothetical protein n=1 Tax=uncultured Clostridium sp. TaxID=59620 RepID=UPI0025F4F16E|nr:hypothetical protein [uncultured Clostridium sp.]
MKKKLLSLVLAGAMVASTSVSAFAATDDKEITVENKGTSHQVEVTGNIADTKDNTLPGTITVTVPTTMAFTINKDGNIEGGDITIRNKSTQSVEVVAKEFIDATPESGIIVKMEDELDEAINTNENRHISLKLEGEKSVGLISNKQKTGLVDLSTDSEFATTDNPSLGTIIPKGDLTLRLTGVAKKGTSGNYEAPDKPVNNRFTLKLKIQKAK